MRASDIRRGQAVLIDNNLMIVTNADHNTPGNLRAKVQLKLRDVKKGTILDKRVSATEDVITTDLDRRNVTYIYSDSEGHWLMDQATYEQAPIAREVFGEDIKYLKENTELTALYHNDKLVSYELPNTVELKVTETSPVVKGATATNQQKDAVMETGLIVKVPPFIDMGEVIRISTDGKQYMSRA